MGYEEGEVGYTHEEKIVLTIKMVSGDNVYSMM